MAGTAKGKQKKVMENPIVDSPIAEKYREAAETGIFDPLADAKADSKSKKSKPVIEEVEEVKVPEEERDIFDAIEAGEVIPYRVTVCDECRHNFGSKACNSCVEYSKVKKIKEA